MTKTVGLSRESTKYLEILKFPKDLTPNPGLLYQQGKSFYKVFRMAFGEGHRSILGHTIPNTENLGVCLVNYHFSIEMLLKSLIVLKNNHKTQKIKTHQLVNLINIAAESYPALSKITDNKDYILLLKELSNSFDLIRYAEGSILLSHNKRSGWKSKKPLEELSNIMHDIFMTLESTFKQEIKKQQTENDSNQKF